MYHLFDLGSSSTSNHVEQIRDTSQLMYGVASRSVQRGARNERQATSAYLLYEVPSPHSATADLHHLCRAPGPHLTTLRALPRRSPTLGTDDVAEGVTMA